MGNLRSFTGKKEENKVLIQRGVKIHFALCMSSLVDYKSSAHVFAGRQVVKYPDELYFVGKLA